MAGHFTIPNNDNCGQTGHPLCRPLTFRKLNFLGISVPKQLLSQGPVEALHDSLVPADNHTTTYDRDTMLGQQLAHRAHELAPRIEMEKLRPAKRAPLVDAGESVSDLFSLFCGKRLDLLVARGHAYNREYKLVRFAATGEAVMW